MSSTTRLSNGHDLNLTSDPSKPSYHMFRDGTLQQLEDEPVSVEICRLNAGQTSLLNMRERFGCSAGSEDQGQGSHMRSITQSKGPRLLLFR